MYVSLRTGLNSIRCGVYNMFQCKSFVQHLSKHYLTYKWPKGFNNNLISGLVHMPLFHKSVPAAFWLKTFTVYAG